MEKQKLISYLKKSFFTGSFKTIVVTLSTIILLPLIINQVGIEKYGLISLTMIFGGMVVFADFGIAKTVTLLIGQDKEKKNVNNIIASGLFINFLLILLIALVVFFIIFFDIPILGEKLTQPREIQNFIVFVGFVILIILLLSNFLVAILEAFYLSHYINIGFALSSVFLNLFIYTASVLSESLYLLLISPALAFICVNIFFLYIIKKYTKVKIGKVNKKEFKHILSLSYKFLGLGTINNLVLPINKYLLILFTGNSALLGVFDIGLKIALIANSFLNSIAQPLFGVFANMGTERSKIFKITVRTSLILFIMYIIGNILYYFLGNEVSSIIDSINYKEIYTISSILLLGLTFSSVSEPFYRALLAQEKLKKAFYLKLLVPIFNFILFFILINNNTLERFTLSYSIAIFLSSLSIICLYIYDYKRKGI